MQALFCLVFSLILLLFNYLPAGNAELQFGSCFDD